ncbi:MAG: tetratricopeptide repeat protein [Verrucomicrobia bacterium]|nr:tetratricopeptide repeat protein [Verrucomicrobiota bacterium]
MKFNGNNPIFRCCLLVFVLTFAAFHAALENDFVNWDDPIFICENPRIQSLDWPHVSEMFTSLEVAAYTPLSQLSLAIDYALWGNNPAGFHFTAILLHGFNAILVFLIASRLNRQAGSSPDSNSSANGGAMLAALCFSLHPMRVESVAWACERRDVLSGFFGLACVLAYTRYASHQSSVISRQTSFPWFLSALFLFVCAVISKAIVVTLPVVLLLLDFHPFRRFSADGSFSWKRNFGEALVEKLPFLFISALAGAITLSACISSGLALDPQRVGWEPRLAQAVVANMSYLRKIFVPLTLNPLDKWYGSYDFSQGIAWEGLIVNGLITLFVLLFRRRFPSALVAWFSYLVIIAPFTGLAQSGLQFTADRYTYLASVPWCILLGGAFHRTRFAAANSRSPLWGQGAKHGIAAVAAAVLLWLGYRAHEQTRIWRDSETLWKHSLRLDPKNPIAWLNLGNAMSEKGAHDLAILAFKQAVGLSPANADAWYNLGSEMRKLERYEEAAAACQKALVCDPFCASAHHNLGWIYARQKNLTAALRHYGAAQKLAPSAATEYNIACCLRDKGDSAAAFSWFRAAAEHGFADAWIGLSELVAVQGDPVRARNILEDGVQSCRGGGRSRIQLALVEAILAQPGPSAKDLALARQMLVELERRLEGRSEKVRTLAARLRLRESSPAPVAKP